MTDHYACPCCGETMQPEHQHYRCPACHYVEPCCQGEPC